MSTIVACDFIGTLLPAPADIVMCACCHTKKRSSNSATCSKRCEWFNAGRCAQCGRGVRPEMPFCSKACASHSVHANWCPTCTVHQCAAGKEHCSDECARLVADVTMIQRPRKRSDTAAHSLLRAEDRERTTVANMFKGCNVMGVVQIAPSAIRRRAYLNHRAAVETRMSQSHAAKYGFGGEGNELKRFCPLNLSCAMQTLSDGSVQLCSAPDCETCQVMMNGFSLQRTGLESHYCMAAADVAASWANTSPCGLRAVCVTRAVTGAAKIVSSSSDIKEPLLEGFDSCVVTDGDATFDGTYLFSDDAIEALYIVLLM